MHSDRARPHSGLTPDAVLDALESVGLRGDGRLLALNSYGNRVYQASLEDGAKGSGAPSSPDVVVAKLPLSIR